VYIVGIDTGGTKTKCALVDKSYNLLGTGSSGPGNYRVAGIENARRNITEAIREALNEGNISESEPITGGFGMGTLDTEDDYDVISEFLDDIRFIDKKYIENDVAIAHYALTAGKPGVTVVAGTGAMAYGTNAEGESYRSSGWGWVIGDEGSGFFAAKRGIQAAAKAYDGRGPETSLLNEVYDHFKVNDFEKVFTTVYDELDHPKNIASFAKPVTEAAERGDDVALRIIEEASNELVLAATTVTEKLEIKPPVRIGCVGGFGRSNLVSRTFESALTSQFPNAELIEPVDNPVVGAIVLVSKQTGDSITDNTVKQLDAQMD
jgi:N-acetylglucosamine kinase